MFTNIVQIGVKEKLTCKFQIQSARLNVYEQEAAELLKIPQQLFCGESMLFPRIKSLQQQGHVNAVKRVRAITFLYCIIQRRTVQIRHSPKFSKFSPRCLAHAFLNPLTPNDSYCGRTAPLTSKVAFYMFIQEIQVLNILNMLYTLRFILLKMQFVS